MSIWPRRFGRDRWESEMRDELHFHLEQQTAAYIGAGMSPEEAHRQAALQFGALEGVKEDLREQRRGFRVEMLRSYLGYGARLLVKRSVLARIRLCSV